MNKQCGWDVLHVPEQIPSPSIRILLYSLRAEAFLGMLWWYILSVYGWKDRGLWIPGLIWLNRHTYVRSNNVCGIIYWVYVCCLCILSIIKHLFSILCLYIRKPMLFVVKQNFVCTVDWSLIIHKLSTKFPIINSNST